MSATGATVVVPPIPAFYACYLLRSSTRHASQYVGSTPNPRRRLRQHNGDTKGGAAKTSRASLRPWEMVTLVTGFPSSVAALQFEWAWQNTHMTRHINSASRITQANSTVRISPKSGRVRKRPARPRICLTDRLANLHLLLTSSSFRRWPLRVSFYAEDVFKTWQKWLQHAQIDETGLSTELVRHQADVGATTPSAQAPPSIASISSVDVSYSSLKPHIQKARALLDDADWLQCAVCDGGVPVDGHGTLICSHDGCESMSHLICLARAFTARDRSDASGNHHLIPKAGQCPSCKKPLQWSALVKELSLRTRGEKEVAALFAKPRRAADADHDDQRQPVSSDSEADASGDGMPTVDDMLGASEQDQSDDDSVVEVMNPRGSDRWSHV